MSPCGETNTRFGFQRSTATPFPTCGTLCQNSSHQHTDSRLRRLHASGSCRSVLRCCSHTHRNPGNRAQDGEFGRQGHTSATMRGFHSRCPCMRALHASRGATQAGEQVPLAGGHAADPRHRAHVLRKAVQQPRARLREAPDLPLPLHRARRHQRQHAPSKLLRVRPVATRQHLHRARASAHHPKSRAAVRAAGNCAAPGIAPNSPCQRMCLPRVEAPRRALTSVMRSRPAHMDRRGRGTRQTSLFILVQNQGDGWVQCTAAATMTPAHGWLQCFQNSSWTAGLTEVSAWVVYGGAIAHAPVLPVMQPSQCRRRREYPMHAQPQQPAPGCRCHTAPSISACPPASQNEQHAAQSMAAAQGTAGRSSAQRRAAQVRGRGSRARRT